jgi:hypothetical protein
MQRTIRQTWRCMKWSIKVTCWIICAPFAAATWASRTTGRLCGTWTLLTHHTLPCLACGHPISLVGRWQCGACHIVYDGFGFASCPVCGDVPPYLACPDCGVGIRNPTS